MSFATANLLFNVPTGLELSVSTLNWKPLIFEIIGLPSSSPSSAKSKSSWLIISNSASVSPFSSTHSWIKPSIALSKITTVARPAITKIKLVKIA